MQILVLGMHRSGTSAVSRLLNLMGVYFGAEGSALEIAEDNKKGFWERKDVLEANNQLLRDNNQEWFKISDLHKTNPFSKKSVSDYDLRIKNIIQNMDAFRPWFIKDPRLCLTNQLVSKHLETPLYILVHRNPLEVAMSLQERNSFPIDYGLKLWYEYNLHAIKTLDKKRTLVVSFNELMTMPDSTTDKIYSFLDNNNVPVRKIDQQQLLKFIDPKLKNHNVNKTGDVLTKKQTQMADALNKGSFPKEKNFFFDKQLIKYENSFDKIYKFSKYEKESKILNNSLKLLEQSYEKKESELINANAIISKYKLELKNKDEAIQKIEKDLNRMSELLLSNEDQLRKKDDLVRGGEDQLRKKDDVIRVLEDQLRKKEDVIREREDQIKKKDELARAREEQLGKKDDIARSLEDQLRKEEDVIREREDQLRKKDDIIRSIDLKNNSSQIDLLKCQNELVIRKQIIDKLKDDNEKLILDFEGKVKSEVNQHKVRIEKITNQHKVDIKNLKKEKNNLSVEIKRLKSQIVNKDELIIKYWDQVQEMRIANRIKKLFKFQVKTDKNQEAINKALKKLNVLNNADDGIDKFLKTDKHQLNSRNYRINIITPSTNIHGGTKRLLMIAQQLRNKGHHVKLIRQHKSRTLDWFDFSVPILDINFNETTDIEYLENKFPNGDILMTYGNCKANSVLANLSPKKGKKVALFMHFGVHDSSLDKLNSKLLQFQLFATTNWIAEEIKKASGRESKIVDFGVHNDQFYPVEVKSEKFSIGALYHKDEWKRSNDVIEAYNLLRKEYDIKLIMFGQVKNPTLPEGVLYYYNPDQNKLREIYSMCQVWVTPSTYEGIGMCSVEAMLCKTPLITVDTGGSRDFCYEDNSFIVEKKSPIAIEEAIKLIISNPKLAINKATKAYQDILQHSWSRSISYYETHFIDLLNKENPASYRSIDYDLTIGIPIHNELEYVKNCIESVKRSTSSNYEIVLVDDVSDQETRAYLESLKGDNIKYIRNFERKGFPFNCNEIIRHSRGKYICLLNSDTVTTKNWDMLLINAIKENPKLGMVGPSTSYGVAKNYDTIAQQLEEVHFKRFEMTNEEIETFATELKNKENGKIIKTEYVNGFCMMLDRSVFSEIGFFDIKFGFGSREEVQFVDRLRAQGYEMGWVKSAYVHHYGHRSFTNYSDSQELWAKNKELYFKTKGQDLTIGITTKRIGIIYNAKFSSSTRKRTFEPHKYLNEYLNIDLIHWPRLNEEFIKNNDIIFLQRIGGLNETIDDNFLSRIEEWIEKYPDKKFVYDLDDFIISSQNELPLKLIKLCHSVTVSTNSLKKSIEKYNDNITVLQNGVDYERVTNLQQNINKEMEIKIVCFSLAGAGIDMLESLGDLLSVQKQAFNIVLYSGEEIDKTTLKHVDVRKNISFDDMFRELKSTDYLINWADHSDLYFEKLAEEYSFKATDKNTFVNSKSALKYYNAAISRTVLLTTKKPLAYSEIVKHKKSGFFIKNAEDACKVIMQLENDLSFKNKVLNTAEQDTITHFSMNATSLQYLNYFTSLN